ncbi:MAG: GNAT family N-acetyltransferase [Pseudomonadota bacterium]
MIDPDISNPRAKHVYEKAGFVHVGDFVMGGSGCFAGCKTHLLVWRSEMHGKPTELNVTIRSAQRSDIPTMVALSHAKRLSYEKAHPQFWRHATDANKAQSRWFETLITQEDHLLLVAESHGQVVGFVIGRLMKVPEVYDPGGLTLMVDDFCVEDLYLWPSIGNRLVDELKAQAKIKGATQILVVCGAHDQPKRCFLKRLGLSVASEWYVGGLNESE